MVTPEGTNRLIESLPASIRDSLLRHVEAVDLPLRTVLYEAESVPRYAHFITAGIASTVTLLSGGDQIEVGLIGRESVVGKIHLLGPQLGMTRCFMQMPGAALRIEFRRFSQFFNEDAAFRSAILRSVQHETLVLAQLSACNRLHEVEERLARWLLMVQDRTGDNELALTQEFLADMLGARRSSVNLAAGSLQRSGLIDYRRSRIRIESRERLEDVACECYPLIRRYFEEAYKTLPA